MSENITDTTLKTTGTTTDKETKMDTSTAKTKGSKAKANGGKAKTPADGGKRKLARLPREARTVQETFRVTEEEHNSLVEKAGKAGYSSMSDFYRVKVGLDKEN